MNKLEYELIVSLIVVAFGLIRGLMPAVRAVSYKNAHAWRAVCYCDNETARDTTVSGINILFHFI